MPASTSSKPKSEILLEITQQYARGLVKEEHAQRLILQGMLTQEEWETIKRNIKVEVLK